MKIGLVEEPARALYPFKDPDAPMQGDKLRSVSDAEGPNTAWVSSHHDKLALSNFEAHLKGFWEWAYVT